MIVSVMLDELLTETSWAATYVSNAVDLREPTTRLRRSCISVHASAASCNTPLMAVPASALSHDICDAEIAI